MTAMCAFRRESTAGGSPNSHGNMMSVAGCIFGAISPCAAPKMGRTAFGRASLSLRPPALGIPVVLAPLARPADICTPWSRAGLQSKMFTL